MDLFELLGEVIGLGCVAFLLYNEGILPRSLNSYFQKVKDGYRKVEAGELSYIAFKEDLRNKCYHRGQIESLQTIRFKEVLLGMLNYDDFIKRSLSNPDITVEELLEICLDRIWMFRRFLIKGKEKLSWPRWWRMGIANLPAFSGSMMGITLLI